MMGIGEFMSKPCRIDFESLCSLGQPDVNAVLCSESRAASTLNYYSCDHQSILNPQRYPCLSRRVNITRGDNRSYHTYHPQQKRSKTYGARQCKVQFSIFRLANGTDSSRYSLCPARAKNLLPCSSGVSTTACMINDYTHKGGPNT